MKSKIVLLQGGISNEREISLETCTAIKKALENLEKTIFIIDPKNFTNNNKINYHSMLNKIKEYNCDIVFNGLHGGDGEDGTIQKFLEDSKIDFTGSSTYASSLSMDKNRSKLIVKKLQIPVPKFISSSNKNVNIKKILEKLTLPSVVKPNASGSSVGVSVVEKIEQFPKAIQLAFEYDNEVIVEEFIKGREITVAILGNKPLPAVEIKPQKGWYDYFHKYTAGETVYEIPAKLAKQEADKVSQYAITIYNEFHCRDYARIDFRYNGKDFYFLEVNTLPGMTELSLVPMAAKAVGISFDELINRIIEKD